MDIDSPPAVPATDPHAGHKHLAIPPFSVSFPLPFRVLFLIGLAQFLWAVNLHVLHLIGLNTSWILDFRDNEPLETTGGIELDPASEGEMIELDTLTRRKNARPVRSESGKLYQPVYKLFFLYSAWVGGGWAVFRLVTGADSETMEVWRGSIALVALGPVLGALVPWRGVAERERIALRRALKRMFLPSLDAPVFFSDVILADILTSFAKVLGDLWISTCQIWNGGISQGRVAQSGWSSYITLTMVCLPYVLRFRQCLLEYYQSSYTSPRPLANALKYFSAFPVILLSAAQKSVVNEIALTKGITVQELGDTGERWFGEHRLFRIWLLGVVINSMYSFYWDVAMDWGLALCDVDTWLGPSRGRQENGIGLLGSPSAAHKGSMTNGRRMSTTTIWGKAKRLVMGPPSISHQRSPCPTPVPSMSPLLPHLDPPANITSNRFFGFGLRQTLLLPDPLVYHLFTLIDLVLRFTWSLKLSSHLHTISEIESGVFMMEALELVRRWMWVFIRIEWETVKQMELQRFGGREGRGQVLWSDGGTVEGSPEGI